VFNNGRNEESIRLKVFDEDGVSTLVKATTTEFEGKRKSYKQQPHHNPPVTHPEPGSNG